MVYYEKVKYMIFGALAVLAILFLTGLSGPMPGRYQISAWGGERIGYGVFVVDTLTGETRPAYNYTTASQDPIDNLGLPFDRFQSEPGRTR
jgi:hypothetical protein